MNAPASPMMKQYMEAKRACPEAILLFRMGDFYELFHDDAKTAAQVLHLTLTSRDKGENAVPMAGFPHHQLESYLGKLIAAGYRVRAQRVRRKEDLPAALHWLLHNPDEPALLDVIVHPEENVYPMIPAGATYQEIICSDGDLKK